jgi:hypothetical protein
MIKMDLADSFYRVWVRKNACPDVIKLGVTFPNLVDGEEPLIAFPSHCPPYGLDKFAAFFLWHHQDNRRYQQ